MKRLNYMSFMAFLVVGCMPKLSPSEMKIFGGTRVLDDAWSNVVAISIHADADIGGVYSCTGTLVTPSLIVTAAHCIINPDVEGLQLFPADRISIVLGNDKDAEPIDVAVTRVDHVPGYQDAPVTGASKDLAYISLAAPVNRPLIPMVRTQEEAARLATPGRMATVVGYGYTNIADPTRPGQVFYGEKFSVTMKINEPMQDLLFIGGQEQDSCSGDSGGPVFGTLEDGSWRLFAVVSRAAFPDQDCGTGGLYTRLSDGMCWLKASTGLSLDGSSFSCTD